MAVDVHRRTPLGIAEDLHHHARMLTLRDQKCGATMWYIMEGMVADSLSRSRLMSAGQYASVFYDDIKGVSQPTTLIVASMCHMYNHRCNWRKCKIRIQCIKKGRLNLTYGGNRHIIVVERLFDLICCSIS